MMVDLIVTNAKFMDENLGLSSGTMVINEGKIIAISNKTDNANDFQQFETKKRVDAKGGLVTQGLIDCHTHLIFAGSRSDEFEQRLNGSTYEMLAKQGGGIKSTVKATRAASSEELYGYARSRLEKMIRYGCLGFEIKSGYGLDLKTECKMLRVAKQLSNDLNVPIHKTYLGAHTLPDEYKDQADNYVSFICSEVLPQIKAENLADSIDVFCESIGFTLSQTEKIFDAAIAMGFDIRCHAEQLNLLGATHSAARRGALSCDHLEFIDESSVEQMKIAGSVAVLLPGAFYFLKETQKPPIDLFRKHQVPMAIATDFNPGSSPCNSLPLMMNMACVLFGLTIQEAWQGVTTHAERVLGWQNIGLKVGNMANFVIWPFSKPVELIYSFGHNVRPDVYINGMQSTCG